MQHFFVIVFFSICSELFTGFVLFISLVLHLDSVDDLLKVEKQKYLVENSVF